MGLIIQKYGGTSIADPKKIKKVAQHIKSCVEKGSSLIVVVSAMGEETDRLTSLAKEVSPDPDPREMDHLLQTGEIVTASLLAMALNDMEVPAISLTAAQIRLIATGQYGEAKIKTLQNKALIEKSLADGKVVIIAGFQGISENGLDIITLGRGGSDTTAVALAAFLGAEICEIYTDVDGVYAIDPRLVSKARRFDTISHDQMIAMSAAGAGVLMDRSVGVAQSHGVRIKVLLSPSIGESTGGTLVTTVGDIADLERTTGSRGIAIKRKVGCIHIFNIPNKPNMAAKIFSTLEDVNIIEIAQSQGGQTAQISILLEDETAKKVFSKLKKIGDSESIICQGLAALTLVDPAMKETPRYIQGVTKALGENKINIEVIATSQTSITVAIKEESLPKAALALAQEFDLLSS